MLDGEFRLTFRASTVNSFLSSEDFHLSCSRADHNDAYASIELENVLISRDGTLYVDIFVLGERLSLLMRIVKVIA